MFFDLNILILINNRYILWPSIRAYNFLHMFKHLAVLFSTHIFNSIGWGDRYFRHYLDAVAIPSDFAQTKRKRNLIKMKRFLFAVCLLDARFRDCLKQSLSFHWNTRSISHYHPLFALHLLLLTLFQLKKLVDLYFKIFLKIKKRN
jgi:hypothetical protein